MLAIQGGDYPSTGGCNSFNITIHGIVGQLDQDCRAEGTIAIPPASFSTTNAR